MILVQIKGTTTQAEAFRVQIKGTITRGGENWLFVNDFKANKRDYNTKLCQSKYLIIDWLIFLSLICERQRGK
jgi:hypothetical protein